MLRFRINSCAHGDRIAWLGCLASDQWLHAWRQHAAWHMVPSSNQLLHAMQHRLALDASLQNQRLRTWRQRCLAHDASLRINGCAHGGSIAWHMMPRSNQLLHAMQHCAWHGMPRFRTNGCARGVSIAWLVMPRLEPKAARRAVASLGTWCLARISCCLQCSIAWHGMPRFKI